MTMARGWRLLRSGPATGARNMALDEAILEACAAGESPPTVRLYTFDPPCLSLGRFQAPGRDVDVETCRVRGIDVVQRPTGGRAVLHWGDLVYAVIAQEDEALVDGGILEAYRRISEALAVGLGRLGVRGLRAEPRRRPLPKTGACFDVPAAYELTLDGYKVTGSAQVRRNGAVLQHGSILVDERALHLDGLLLRDGRPLRVPRPPAVTVPEALGRTVTPADVAEALEAGFREVLGWLAPGELSAGEEATAARYEDAVAATLTVTR